jgi:hypothetical protein
MENKPRISKWIGRGYMLLTIAMIILYGVVIALSAQFNQILVATTLGVVMTAVVVLLCAILYSLYKTAYVIEGGKLYSWSPFAIININTRDVAKVEQTRIPFYFK